ncbi:MAG: hypothetical protein ACI8W0_002093, partial [Flavobacterium sp.]
GRKSILVTIHYADNIKCLFFTKKEILQLKLFYKHEYFKKYKFSQKEFDAGND